MLSRSEVKQQLAAFTRVMWHYDGLKGKVIAWANAHGNTSHDPAHRVWVLDPQGRELGRPGGKENQPSSFVSWLKTMQRGSFPLIDVGQFKKLKAEATRISRRQRLGTTLAALRKKAADEAADEATRAEAGTLVKTLTDYAEWSLERAKTLEASDPAGALAAYRDTARQFKGDAVGDQAQARYDRLRKDPAFKNELKAQALWNQVEAIKERMRPARAGKPLDLADEDTRKKNIGPLRQCAAILGAIVKRYPDTVAAGWAKQRITEWKLG